MTKRIENQFRSVSKEELENFVNSYPRDLETDLNRIVEPWLISFNDWTLGNWPESVVAMYKSGDPPGTAPSWGWGPPSDFKIRAFLPPAFKNERAPQRGSGGPFRV